MIGAPLPPSLSLYSPSLLRPASAPALPQAGRAASWMEGLGLHGGPALRADVATEQRGLSAQQHAERVLAALVG